MASLESVDGNVGRFFPRRLSTDTQDIKLKYPFDKLYEILCYEYQVGKITLDDFKDFRKVLGAKKVQDIEEYIDLIFYFLSIEKEELTKKLQYFDEKFDCHALEVRTKIIEKDEETEKTKEKYVFLQRKPSFSDIITVSCAVHSQLLGSFCPVLDNCFVGIDDLNLQEKLKLCDTVLDDDLQPTSVVVEIILRKFEERYNLFKDISELEVYRMSQRKRVIERARQHVWLKKKKYQTELEHSYRDYNFQKWYQHDVIAYKRGGKRFGTWHNE